jgi:hypothetical protein
MSCRRMPISCHGRTRGRQVVPPLFLTVSVEVVEIGVQGGEGHLPDPHARPRLHISRCNLGVENPAPCLLIIATSRRSLHFPPSRHKRRSRHGKLTFPFLIPSRAQPPYPAGISADGHWSEPSAAADNSLL